MHGDGPTAMGDDFSLAESSARSLDQRLALVERHLISLLGVVHGLREELDGAADEHIDP